MKKILSLILCLALAVALFISLIIILYVFFIFPRRQAKQNTNPDLVADQDIKIYEKKGRQ